jgi:hypothetical protein
MAIADGEFVEARPLFGQLSDDERDELIDDIAQLKAINERLSEHGFGTIKLRWRREFYDEQGDVAAKVKMPELDAEQWLKLLSVWNEASKTERDNFNLG